MTASTSIETAWTAAIWQDASITSITDKIYLYPITKESETEAARYYFNSKINFIEALTTRAEFYQESARILGRAVTFQFIVTVNYYKEIDPEAEAYGDVRNFFETLTDLVRNDLDSNWSNTVDFYRPQEVPPEIEEVTLDGRRSWRGTYKFIGTKADTIT